MQGLLSHVTVRDLTPPGKFYPIVLATIGDKTLDFKFFRFDEDAHATIREAVLGEPCMQYLQLHMDSIQYVHTRRFITMLLAYVNQFQQMQHVLSRLRAAAAGIIAQANKSTTFFQLDISVEKPVIIVPRNSFSFDYLQADLQSLRVTNELQVFPFAFRAFVKRDIFCSLFSQ